MHIYYAFLDILYFACTYVKVILGLCNNYCTFSLKDKSKSTIKFKNDDYPTINVQRGPLILVNSYFANIIKRTCVTKMFTESENKGRNI